MSLDETTLNNEEINPVTFLVGLKAFNAYHLIKLKKVLNSEQSIVVKYMRGNKDIWATLTGNKSQSKAQLNSLYPLHTYL